MNPLSIESPTKEDFSKVLYGLSLWPGCMVIISLFMLTACATNKSKITLEIPHYETADEYYQEGTNLAKAE